MAATNMLMAGSAATASLRIESPAASSLSSSAAVGRVGFVLPARQQRRVAQRMTVKAAKQLHFNKDGSAIKKMQVGGVSSLGFLGAWSPGPAVCLMRFFGCGCRLWGLGMVCAMCPFCSDDS